MNFIDIFSIGLGFTLANVLTEIILTIFNNYYYEDEEENKEL